MAKMTKEEQEIERRRKMPKATCSGIKELDIEPHECYLSQLTRSKLCMYHRGYKSGVNKSKMMRKYLT